MALSQKKSTTRAGIVQEEQDDYFKEKMEEYRLFLERHLVIMTTVYYLVMKWKVIVNMMKSLNQKENDRIEIIAPLEIMQMWGADFLSA